MFESSKQGAVHVVSGDCPLNVEGVTNARRVFEECLGKGQPRVVFQMNGVALLDSAGLVLLLDIRDACLRRGGALQLAAPNPLCRDILRATGLAQQFTVYDDAISAVGSFAQ